MTQDKRPPNGRKPADPRDMTRDERLKAALKANMARRKAQARARASGDAAGADDDERQDNE